MPGPFEKQIDFDSLLALQHKGQLPATAQTEDPIPTRTPTVQPADLSVSVSPDIEASYPYNAPVMEKKPEGVSRFLQQMGVGFVETAGSFPHAINWAEQTLIKDFATVNNWAPRNGLLQDFTDNIDSWVEERTPEDIDLSDQIARGLGGIPLFFIPAMGVGKIAQVAKIAPKIAQHFSIGTMAVLDSASTAGTVYSEELRKTGDADLAGSRASKAFLANLPVSLVMDKYGIFGNVRRTGIKGVAEKAITAGATGAVAGGIMSPTLALIRDEEIKAKDVGTAMIVGATTAGVMGVGVQLLGNYNGKPIDLIKNDPVTDAQVAAVKIDKEQTAREAQGIGKEVSGDALSELENLNTGMDRQEASDVTGHPDFRLKSEEELLQEYIENRVDTPEINSLIADRIIAYYQVKQEQIKARAGRKILQIADEGQRYTEPITSDISPAEKSAGIIDAILTREENARNVGLMNESNLRKSPKGRELLRDQLRNDEVAPDVAERILDFYDVKFKQQDNALTSTAEQTLQITFDRKEAITIVNKQRKNFVKALPDDPDRLSIVANEVLERYKNSSLGTKLEELRLDTEGNKKAIERTQKLLDETAIGQKLVDVTKKQDATIKKPTPKKAKIAREEKDIVVEPIKKEKKLSKKARNIMKLREDRNAILKEREKIADEIYRSEISNQDTTPEFGKLLARVEVLDNRLSAIAFSLNERPGTVLKDITQIVPDFLKKAKDITTDPRQITEGLENVGGAVYQAGMTLKDFIRGMRDTLGDLFDRFAGAITGIYNRVKAKLTEETGAITFGRGTRITANMSPEEATKIIKDADITNDTLSDKDIRKSMLPAAKLADGSIKDGDSYEDIGNWSAESPIQELGYLSEEGVFIPASAFRPDTDVTNEPIKVLKESKTNVKEALDLAYSPAVEKATEGRIISTSASTVTIKDLKAIIRKMKKKAKGEKISFEDYMRKLGLSEKAMAEFNSFDAYHLAGRNVIKKITRHQEAAFKEFEAEGADVQQAMKELGIAEPKEGKKLTYKDAGKLMAYMQNELGLKTQDVTELEVVLNQIMDGTRYTDKRNELQKTVGFVKDLLLSPKQVLSRTEVGTKLYKIFDQMQIKKEKDLEHLYGRTGFDNDRILHLLRNKESSEKIANVLDGQKKAEGYLTAEEADAVKIQRESYDYMVERFVDIKSRDAAEAQLVRQLADTVQVAHGEKVSGVKKTLDAYQKDYDISKGGMEALDLLRMRVDDYLPHIFDRGDLIKTAAENLQTLLDTNPKSPQVEKLRDIISRLEGGSFIMHNEIPRDLFFAHLEKRSGSEGFKLDAGLAFQSYVNSWAKKVYVEPAVNAGKDLYIKLPAEQKTYAKWFIMEVAGRNKRHPGSAVVSQLEWIRTLGLNLGSALGNATGIVNTVTEAGRNMHAWEGFKRAATKEGLEEFYATGLARSIPQITAIEEVPHTIEKIRTVAGIFFNTVERGLRNHAYHTGKAQGEAMGLTGDDLTWHSIDFVNKTQHRYGVVGMAQGMRGWMGVATQFSSYPIKQAELIHSWLRNPDGSINGKGTLKILSYMSMSAGLTVTMKELFNTDVSNFLGIGITYGELMETGISLSKGDWLAAEKHWKLTTQGGHGILPSSVVPVGPFIGLLGQIHDTHSPRYLSRVGGELTPVMANKMLDLYYALKDGDSSTDKYPIYSYEAKDFMNRLTEGPKDLKYTLGLRQQILRAFGPKPAEETAKQAQEYSRFVDDTQITKILKQYDDALLTGDGDKMKSLFQLYPGIVYDRGTGGALRRRERLTRTRAERDMKRKKRIRQRATL